MVDASDLKPDEMTAHAGSTPALAITPEEKRIRIAELCGWTRVTPVSFSQWEGVPPAKHEASVLGHSVIPDYLNDLNAMHEAEATLSDEQKDVMQIHMDYSVGVKWPRWHATAAERAEAFLLTLNAKVPPGSTI